MNAVTLSHPGEILLEEFLQPLGISQYRLAKDIGVSPRRINKIVHGNRAITPDTALRLAKYFQMSERFFLNLQSNYELRLAKRTMQQELLNRIRPWTRADLDMRPNI